MAEVASAATVEVAVVVGVAAVLAAALVGQWQRRGGKGREKGPCGQRYVLL